MHFCSLKYTQLSVVICIHERDSFAVYNLEFGSERPGGELLDCGLDAFPLVEDLVDALANGHVDVVDFREFEQRLGSGDAFCDGGAGLFDFR